MREFTLYEEAMKRQERWLERQKREAEGVQKAKVPKSYSRDPYVQQKYIKEYNNALLSLGIPPESSGAALTYDQMSTATIL